MVVVSKSFVIPVVAAIAAQLAAPAIAFADRVKVAIVPGLAVNLDAARVDALSQELADVLQTELDIDAIGGLEVRRLLPAEVPPDCVANAACIADVARRLGASQLLFVVMVDTGTSGAIQIDSTWVNAATGASSSRPAIDIASLADARARLLASARQLLPDAPVRPKPATGGGAGLPPTHLAPAVPRHFTLPAKITAATTVIGLGVGIGFGLATRSKFDTCDRAPADCGDDERRSIRRFAFAADAGYLVALGSAIATSVLFATSGREGHIVVEPSPSGVTVGAMGRF